MADSAGPYRPSGGRLAAMAAFATLALVGLAVLADVRLHAADDLWFEGVSDVANRQGMTILMLAGEAIALVAMWLLLLIHPRPGPVDDEWVSTGGVQIGGDTRIQIGCPGCGTVFEKPLTAVDEPHEQDFRCPNCGRAGRLRKELRQAVSIREMTCGNCGQGFKAYHDTAECPFCHAPQ